MLLCIRLFPLMILVIRPAAIGHCPEVERGESGKGENGKKEFYPCLERTKRRMRWFDRWNFLPV